MQTHTSWHSSASVHCCAVSPFCQQRILDYYIIQCVTPYLKRAVENRNEAKHPFGLSNAKYLSARAMKRERRRKKRRRNWRIVEREIVEEEKK